MKKLVKKTLMAGVVVAGLLFNTQNVMAAKEFELEDLGMTSEEYEYTEEDGLYEEGLSGGFNHDEINLDDFLNNLERPTIEEPVEVEEKPVIEEPVIEEPVIEEPVIEEPVIEEPVIEEPVIEEPVIVDPEVIEDNEIEAPVDITEKPQEPEVIIEEVEVIKEVPVEVEVIKEVERPVTIIKEKTIVKEIEVPVEVEIEEEEEEEIDVFKDEHLSYIKGYKDGSVRPNANITRAEASAAIYRLLEDDYKEQFNYKNENLSDIEGHWSQKHITVLNNAKIINGYTDGTFRPNEEITRAEVASIFNRFFTGKSTKNTHFTDIKGHWGEKDINAATEKGFIKGYANKTFRPDDKIKRSEFVTLVNRVLNRGVKKENIPADVQQFTDLDADAWYYEDMVEATNAHDFNVDEAGNELWTSVYTENLE